MIKLPLPGGLCTKCEDNEHCCMGPMLTRHKENEKMYGKSYESKRPDYRW